MIRQLLRLLALLWTMSAGAQLAPVDQLPDSHAGTGTNDITQAWLVAPTDRYTHGVLGDTLEAAGLEALLANGQRIRHELADDVFEDLIPRVQDLNGDQRDEIILVRSNQQFGARLSIWGMRDGQLTEIATGPAIGRANRWLNPIGAADFDNDGRQEIAYIQTPHIGGILRIFEYQPGEMQEEYRASGFSNHRIGDSDLSSLHAIDDYDGDGIADLKIMSVDLQNYRIMRVENNRLNDWNP